MSSKFQMPTVLALFGGVLCVNAHAVSSSDKPIPVRKTIIDLDEFRKFFFTGKCGNLDIGKDQKFWVRVSGQMPNSPQKIYLQPLEIKKGALFLT